MLHNKSLIKFERSEYILFVRKLLLWVLKFVCKDKEVEKTIIGFSRCIYYCNSHFPSHLQCGIASNSLANRVMQLWKDLRWRRKIGNFRRRGRHRLMVWSSDVTKISSCQVNTTSRWGIKQLVISFGSIFLPGTTFVIYSRRKSPAPAS